MQLLNFLQLNPQVVAENNMTHPPPPPPPQPLIAHISL